MQLVLLDFEGIQMDQTDRTFSPRDHKMFTLAVLLSSAICFNSREKFDESSMLEMGLIKDLWKHIKIRAPLSTRESGKPTPGGPGAR